MKFCPECGSLWGKTNFCANCGKSLQKYIDDEKEVQLNQEFPLRDEKAFTVEDNLNFLGDLADGQSKQNNIDKMLSPFEVQKHQNGNYTIVSLKDKTSICITIPSCVESIGVDAFANTNIMQVVLSEGLLAIEDRAFKGCQRLSEINFPTSLIFIGEEAFSDCVELDIEHPSVKLMSPNSFHNNKRDIEEKKLLERIEHEDQTSLENQFYFKVVNAEQYVITGVKDIEATSLYIPDKVVYIEPNVLDSCFSLKEITVDEKNRNYQSIDGVLYSKTPCFIPKNKSGEWAVPYGVCNPFCLCGCENLTTVVLPDTMKEISSGMFKNCTLLETVVLPESITSIADSAFENCRSLKQINIPNGVTKIGGAAFKGCESLTDINLPDNLHQIEASCFEGCKNLKAIIIPNSINFIGRRAFWECASISKLVVPDGITGIGEYAFCGCNFYNVTIPKTVHSIGRGAFWGCKSAMVVRGTKALFKDAFDSHCYVTIY